MDSQFCKCRSKIPNCLYNGAEMNEKSWIGDKMQNAKPLTQCLDKVKEKEKLFQNALDLACTLVKIMTIFAIPECKAKKAVDSIIYALLHFKCIRTMCSCEVKRILNTDQLYCDLRKISGMTKCEARLACCIVKQSFKAFYYKQKIDYFDDDYVCRKKWQDAICEMVQAYVKYCPCSEDNVRCISWKLNNTLEWYIDHKMKKSFPPNFIASRLEKSDSQYMFRNAATASIGEHPTASAKSKNKILNQFRQRQSEGEQEEFEEDVTQKSEQDLTNCLKRLTETEALNKNLLEDIKRKDEEMNNVKSELETIQNELNESKKRACGPESDFEIRLFTTQGGEKLELELKNITPELKLDHVCRFTFSISDESYEYVCDKNLCKQIETDEQNLSLNLEKTNIETN